MGLRVAIVGCGKVADHHVEEIHKLSAKATVAAACDLELLLAEQLATRFQIPAYFDSLDTMLAEAKPDVVHITTPPHTHLPIALRAMSAGCHVLVEKPFTPTYADSCALISHAVESDRKLTIGYTYLNDPPALKMRELIAKGVLGEPVHVESYYGYDLSGAYGSAVLSDTNHWVHRLPGRLFQNNADHLLNKLLEFIDDDAPEVRAFACTRREPRFGDDRDNIFDEVRAVIQGRKVSAYATFSSSAKPVGHWAKVYGTKNTLFVDYVARTVTVEAGVRLPSAIGRLLPAFGTSRQFKRAGMENVRQFMRSNFHYHAGLKYLFNAFYDSILEGKSLPVSYRDILRVAAMIEEIVAQAGNPLAGSLPASVRTEIAK